RAGDFRQSPYMWGVGGPGDGGKLEGTAEPIAIEMTVALRPIQFEEEALVTLPRGMKDSVGTRLLTYRLGPGVPGQGQVVMPTGVVQISATIDGSRVRARLVEKYEDVFAGNGVTTLEPFTMAPNVFPKRVEFGLSTHVAWIYSDPELPGRGSFVIFTA